MADKALTIRIKSVGADSASTEVRKVSKSLDDVAKNTQLAAEANKRFLTAAEAEAQRVGMLVAQAQKLAETKTRAANSAATLARALIDVKGKAQASEFAFYNLDAALSKSDNTINTLAPTVRAAGTATNKMGMLANQASYQIQDFTVQVGAGQSAITAFAQQAPQLLGAFSAAGLLTGGATLALSGFAAALPIVILGGKKLAEMFGETKERAEDAAENIATLSKFMGETEEKRFDGVIQSLEDLKEATAAVKHQTDLTKEASNQLSIASLSNAEKQGQALKNLIDSLGLQIDKIKEIQAISEAETQKRQMETQQAIAGEQQKITKAREAQTEISDALGQRAAALEVEKATLVQLGAKLEALRKERDLLKQIAEGERYDKLPPSMEDFAAKTRARPGSYAGYQGQIREEAGKQLNDTTFQAELKGTEERLYNLSDKIETQSRVIIGMENALNAAVQSTQDIEGAVGIKIQELNETLAQSTLLSQSETLLKTQEAAAVKLTEVYNQIETSNAAGEAAKQTILAAAADGKVTANEQKDIADDVRLIIQQVQSGVASTKGNIQELINLQKTMAQAYAKDSDLVRQHSAQINQLFQRLR